jgi:predicted ATPase/class 3 adenylate cyclase/DNA-binding CsgD family transcriptional regulator
MVDRVGQQLGNYRLVRLLGRGGFAEVYLGEHLRFKQQTAIKVLHTYLTGKEVEHFQHEAETIATLAHPAIIRVLDFDIQEGVPFLVMEYAPNGSLRRQHPKGEVVPLPTLVSYVQQVASALHYAHEHTIIHRDVKPENMLLGRRGEVLLSDFGLATVAHATGSPSASMQGTGGTIAYMAPEQIEGHPRRTSDQYALGAVVYEWLCGKPPFEGSLSQVMVQHLSMPPPSLRERVPTISPTVEQLVLRALAKDPKQRFACVADFAQALEQAWREEASGQTLPLLASGYPAEAGHRVTSGPHLPAGTVTLLFTDIERSTQLLQQLGERYASLLSECRHLLRAAFREHRGHEVDTQGDAFFVAFARATDGVSAAVAVQRAMAFHAWPNGVTVRVRIGLHTGEPQLCAEGYVGLDVHRAARIMSAGHGGQVLLSQTTRDLVEHDLPGGVSLQDLGAHRLKDLQHKSHLFQLVMVGLPAAFPPPKTLDSHPNNLPIQPTSLIGREKEVATVQHLLRREDVRLLTLTGPGGTGKTRLGLQVAAESSERFVDGVFFVNLAPISDPALVVPTIAQTLELKETGEQSLLDLLKTSLREKQLLLLLDNFEQVVSAASQVADLLAACPKLKIMVTSRMVLHVRAEHEFAVPPLALPDPTRLPDLVALSQYDAVALFIQRAQAVKPTFQLTNANAPAVAEICARLDGLPLAIELAAARIKLLPPQALLARLGQRLQMLTGGARDAPARQQTLRNTIEWSYQLLDSQEQRLFQRLSVFVGGCTPEAIETVCTALETSTPSISMLDGVASLLDKSLLQQREQEGEEPRLLMLETMREFGLEALATSGELEATRQAHALYYLALAEEAESELVGPQQLVWLERLEREHGNLRAALRWSLEQGEARQGGEIALQLSSALRRFWQVRGHLSEGRNSLEQALAGSEGAVASLRAKALIAAASLAVSQGDTARTEALCQESLPLCKELGDTKGIAHILYLLGWATWRRGNSALAHSLTEEALVLFRKVGDEDHIAWSLFNLAGIVSKRGEYARARVLFEESLARHRELGNKRGIAYSLSNLAEVLFLSLGDWATVRSLLEESLTLSREVGDKRGIADYFCLSGQLTLQQSDAVTACSLLEESVKLYREMGNQWSTAGSLSLLGKVATIQGDYVTARALYEESLAIAREGGFKWHIALSLEGLAGVVAAQRNPTWAARLWGAAESLRDALGSPIPPVERAFYERSFAATRTQLGEKIFAAAWAEGRTMTPEQVLVAQGPETTHQQIPAGSASAPPAKASGYPAGLTCREVEVLSLVAAGLTDVQIAEQLVISPRTVSTHLTSIYSKLGISSRSAATRFAVEHQLV